MTNTFVFCVLEFDENKDEDDVFDDDDDDDDEDYEDK